LKSLEARKIEIGDAIDAFNSTILGAEDKIEKAKKMIKGPAAGDGEEGNSDRDRGSLIPNGEL